MSIQLRCDDVCNRLAVALVSISAAVFGTAAEAAPRVFLSPSVSSLGPGESVAIDVFVEDVTDLRLYEVALGVMGSEGGSLDLTGLAIDEARSDFVFAGVSTLACLTDPDHLRMTCTPLSDDCVSVPVGTRAYLGTYTLTANTGTSASFDISIVDEPSTFLLDCSASPMTPLTLTGAAVDVTVPVPTISLSPEVSTIGRGESVAIDVFIENASRLRLYEVVVEVANPPGASLDLTDLVIDEGRGDFVFAGIPSLACVTNPGNRRITCTPLSDICVDVPAADPAYLGTYTFTADTNTVASFSVSIAEQPISFVLDCDGNAISPVTTVNATVNVEVPDPTVFVSPAVASVGSGGSVDLDIFIQSVDDLRLYEIVLDVTGGTGGSLDLTNLAIDEGRSDFVFAGISSLACAADPDSLRMTCTPLSNECVSVPTGSPAYLGTYTFAVNAEVGETFDLSVTSEPTSFLLDCFGDPITPFGRPSARIITIEVQDQPPVAICGGPYSCFIGTGTSPPCSLDGCASYDPDEELGDYVTAYGWELDNQPPFDFDEGGTCAVKYIWDTVGTYQVGLRVTDNPNSGLAGAPMSNECWTTVEIKRDSGIPGSGFAISPVDPDGENGWYITTPTVTLTAADPPVAGEDASGVCAIHYQYGDSGEQVVAGATAQFEVADGDYVLDYFAVDCAGNVEQPHSVQLIVDREPPNTRITVGPPDGAVINNMEVTFCWTGEDGVVAPGELLFAFCTESNCDPTTGPFGPTTCYTIQSLTEGTYAIRVSARDSAGSVDPTPAMRTFTVDLTPPEILHHAPVGRVNEIVGHADVTFSERISIETFSAADIVITGPKGSAISVSSPQSLGGNVWRISFPGQSAEGEYCLYVGPHVEDLGGNEMDQDGDGIPGEDPSDVYVGCFTIDTTPPTLIGQTSPGTVTPISHVDVTFSEEVVADSCAADDITLTDPTGSPIAVTGPEPIDGNVWRITFAAPTANGEYCLTVAPCFEDLAGNGMDQDGDGTSGEDPDDVYVGCFTMVGPDLEPTNPGVPISAPIGGQIDVSWRVANVGDAAATATWTDCVYLSDDDRPGGDTQLACAGRPDALEPAAWYEQGVGITIPAVEQADQWIIVRVDDGDSVYELNENNNFVVDPITISGPDLAVMPPVAPSEATGGGSVILEYTIWNNGSEPASVNWQDAVYLSDNDTLEPGADELIRLDPINEAPLEPGEEYSRSRTVALPVGHQATTAYLIVQTDVGNDIAELSESNNVRVSGPIQITPTPAPNLSTLVSTVAPSPAVFGETVTVEWSGRNVGTDTASGTWSDLVFLSSDAQLSTDDRFLGLLSIDAAPLGVGATYDRSLTVALPLDLNTFTGDYCILVKADGNGAIDELDEGDNVGVYCPLYVELPPLPNLEILNVSGPATVAVGETARVTWDVINTGGVAADTSFLTAVLASPDGTPGDDTPLINVVFDQPLVPKQVEPQWADVVVPELRTDELYFTVCADTSHDVLEANEQDNCAAAAATSVYDRPDLTVTPFTPPALLEADETVAISWTVDNIGAAAATPFWIDAVYLSTDAVFGSDVLLRTEVRGDALSAGGNYPGQTTVTIPSDLQGDFYFIIETDRGDRVIESGDPANNVQVAAVPTRIDQPPRPNLVVTDVITPLPGVVGQPMTVEWTITNISDVRSADGFWLDRVVASLDDQLSADDIVLSDFTNTDALEPLGSYVGAGTVEYPSIPGDYHLIVVADVTDTVNEGLAGGEGDNIKEDDATFSVGTFEVLSAAVDVNNAPAGTPITISGDAVVVGTSLPAVGVPVVVSVSVRGFVRELIGRTDEAGRFEVEFVPGPTEGGRYGVSAGPSHDTSLPELTAFHLWSLVATPYEVDLSVVPGIPKVGEFTLRNAGDEEQQGTLASVLNAPAGVAVEVTSGGIDLTTEGIILPGLDSVDVTYTVTADVQMTIPDPVRIEFTSAEGGTTSVDIALQIGPLEPRVVVVPEDLSGGEVSAAMPRGVRTFAQFRVRNIGGGSTGHLAVDLPNVPWMSLATPTPIAPIPPAGEGAVVLQLDPPADLAFGTYSGSVWIHGALASINVPFRFEAVSNGIGDLLVRATDEGTYWNEIEGYPLVAGARVILQDSITGALAASGLTVSTGRIQFEGLTEAYYDVEVTADDHGVFRTTVLVAASQLTEIEAFMPQEVVRYTWTVVPTEIEDEYRIIITADFQTNVPAPVVTMTPESVDLLDLTLPTQIDFTITNHGLITADNVQFSVGESSLYHLTPMVTDIGDLPAQTSVVVPVLIEQAPLARRSRNSCDPVFVRKCHDLVCGNQTYTYCITSALYQRDCPPTPGGCADCGGGAAGGGGGGGTTFTINPVQTQSLPCDPCAIKCLKSAAGCIPGVGCPLGMADCGVNFALTSAKDAVKNVVGCIGAGVNCVVELTPLAGQLSCACSLLRDCRPTGSPFGDCNDLAGNVPCSPGDAITGLYGSFFGSRAAAAGLTDPEYQYFEEQYHRLGAFVLSYEYIFGDVQWIIFEGVAPGDFDAWMTAFDAAAADGSELGGAIGATEHQQLLNMPYPAQIDASHVDAFVARWNRSVDYWDQGILSETDLPLGWDPDFIALDKVKFLHDYVVQAEQDVVDEGFDGIVEAYEYAKLVLESDRAEVGEGVCATVRIQIDQTATVTRAAFRATLELENGGGDPLEGVFVEIKITNATGQDATDLFGGMDAPELLSGISAVDGTGSVPGNGSATASWVIVPSNEAAPLEPEEYFVSGTLMYELDGALHTVPLFPIRIDVLPNPRLELKYFLETVVYSDDPFTPEIEPAIPFSLGLLVKNSGAGIAKNMRITSAQPEIIENERGLLIDFSIIGTQVGTQELSPSLTVVLGDIRPDATAVARWLMVSTLQGEFVAYSAEFEHVNSLGDPRLSLIDSVDIFGLNHIVLASGAEADNLPDFLTNDFPDLQDLPDRVHLSDGSVAQVDAILDAAVTTDPANLTASVVSTPPDDWAYIRIDDPFSAQYVLTSATRSDGEPITVGYNAWQTDRVNRSVPGSPLEQHVHVFDRGGTGIYTLYFQERLLVPSSPLIADITATTALLAGVGTLNETWTLHAVYDEASGLYIGPDARLRSEPFWQARDAWADTRLRALVPETLYWLQSKAQFEGVETPFGSPTPATTSVPGDADGDRLVTQADVDLVRAVLGSCYAAPEFDVRSDLNGDDCATFSDLGIVLRNIRRGDYNRDGYVTLDDFATFHTCVSGPISEGLSSECAQGDFEFDDDIDLADFGAFQRAFESDGP